MTFQVLVAGTKCMPGIGSLFEPLLKGRTVLGVLRLVFISTVGFVVHHCKAASQLRKSSLTTHLLNNAVDIPVLYIN